jgi:hypothetical protein
MLDFEYLSVRAANLIPMLDFEYLSVRSANLIPMLDFEYLSVRAAKFDTDALILSICLCDRQI